MPLDRKRCAEPVSGFCRRTVGSGQFYRYGGRKVRFPVGSKASFRISSAGSPAKFDCCSLSKPGVSYDVCQRCWRRQDIGGQWRISNRHYRYTGIVLYPLFGRLRTRHRGLCPALERHAIWHRYQHAHLARSKGQLVAGLYGGIFGIGDSRLHLDRNI